MNWKSPGSSIIFSTMSGWLEMATKAQSAASCFGLMVVALAAVGKNIADVADIAQAVAERALRELVAEMSAESAEDKAEFVVGIAVPVETAEHEEPAAGRDLVAHPRQLVGHRGEREFFPRHRRVIRLAQAQAGPRG